MHALELLEVALDLDQGFLGHLHRRQLLAEGGDLFAQFRALAQFLLDGLELLAEVVFPLALIHLATGFHGDLLLHFQQLNLALQQLIHALEPQARVGNLEDFLGLLELEVQVGSHQIRQAARVVQVAGDDEDLLGQGFAQGHSLFKGLLHAAEEGILLQIRGLHFGFGQWLHPSLEEVFCFSEVLHAHPLETLHQGADAAIRQLQDAHDESRGAHLIEVFGARIVHLCLLLRQQQDHAVLHQGRVHGADGFLATYAEGQDHVGVDHHVPKWQDRQFLGQLGLLIGYWGQENVIGHGETSILQCSPTSYAASSGVYPRSHRGRGVAPEPSLARS